jgi:sterol desaturase/sphingolipid hydroxylase (fatty acid hydroxylase superfamily)
VGDFFYYWCHRAQHRFLWRFHAVHHSVRELSGVAAYHHITEEAMKVVLYALPIGFFIDDPLGIPILGVILGVQGHYLHSITRLNLGPLGRVIQDNRFHRIHHSIQPEHYDKNFGVFTTLWDVLFGTAWLPAPGEWPDTGVADMPEPRTVSDFYFAPFRPGAEAAPSAPQTASGGS